MQGSDDHRLASRERLALALLAVFAIGCMIAAVVITSQVLARIGGYGTASNDNLQWTISQIEVDQLKFQLALDKLDPAEPASPDAARRQFDLLYSRATTLRNAPAYRDALAPSGAQDDVGQVIAILDEMIPLIDASAAALLASRDRLGDQAERMTPPIRRIAAEAIAIDARRSEAERTQLTAQIMTLAGLSMLMFIALFLLLVLLWWLYRGRLATEAAIAAAREDALAIEQARAQFLGMTSHEMRTPLSGLLGALELLEDSDLDSEQRHNMRIMRLSGEALRTHIDEALDGLGRRGDDPVLRPAPFDLDALLADLVAGQTIPAEARGNTLRLDPERDRLGTVNGDARRLGQVLLNLVANAVKFTRDGTITLSARRGAGDAVVFGVHDTGIGIAKAEQPAVFEDFIRLPGTGQGDGGAGGTGLGLGIARRIAKAMGGNIAVESRPGSGSTFTVTVPLPAVPVDEAEPTDASPAPLARPLRVLLVEDTAASRNVTEAMLTRDGHEVMLASDGLEGVQAAQDAAFDLILMDVAMPRLDGIEATRRIRSGGGPNAATRIVALTAYHGEKTVVQLRKAGADMIEVKPLSRAALRALLAQVSRAGGLIDADHIAQMTAALPEARLAETMDAFRNEVEALLADLKETAPRALGPRIHSLAGTAGACDASALHARLAEIETAIEAGDDARVHALLACVPSLWCRTRAALHAQGCAA